MVVPPLQVVLGREGEQPDPDTLAHALVIQMAGGAAEAAGGGAPQASLPALASQQEWQQEWVQVLSHSTHNSDGKAGGTAEPLPAAERLARIRTLLSKSSSSRSDSGTAGTETTQGQGSPSGPCSPPLTLALARSLVSANSASAPSQDPAAARLRWVSTSPHLTAGQVDQVMRH
jgi:hypothetical protein